jgi:hypothetical protein
MSHDEHRYAALYGKQIDAQFLSHKRADEAKLSSRGGHVTCLVCGEPMVPKLGEQLKWHFAHRADREFVYHEPESNDHKAVKKLLLEWGLAKWPGCEARCEWRLAEIRQIADVLVLPPGMPPLALEIQYSNLSPADWRARHLGYRNSGVADFWFLGHSRLKLLPKGRARLDGLSSALVAGGHELMYLGPRGAVTWLRLPPSARFKARSGRLGTVSALVVKGQIGQLVIEGGRASLSERP